MPTTADVVLMSRARRTLGVAVAALLSGNVLVLSAHGSSAVDPTTSRSAVAAGITLPPEVTLPPTTTPPPATVPAGKGAKKGAAATTTTTTTVSTGQNPSPPPPLPGGYDFQITLTPTCAKVGEEFTVTVHLKPMGGVAMMAWYADGDYHETRHAGVSRDGKPVVYKWKAPAAPGDAWLTAQAHDPETKRTGVKTLPFRVAGPAESC